MNYNQLVNFLWDKYGHSNYDYFSTPNCASKNVKARRSSEGLIIHHVDEDKAEWLSKPEIAIKYPFEYQKADRLVYCNLLEHLILHIKISEKTNNRIGLGGAIRFICRELNDVYSDYKYTSQNGSMKAALIRNNEDDYIAALKIIWGIVKKGYNLLKIIHKEDLATNNEEMIVKEIYDHI